MSSRERAPAAWAGKAEHDLTAIRIISAASDVPWDIVVFHAQQAAEKYLKALLVHHQRVVPKIHDLERLFQLVLEVDPSLPALASDCRRLTQLGFMSRYPDNPEEPSEHDGQEAIRLANNVCDAIRTRLAGPADHQ